MFLPIGVNRRPEAKVFEIPAAWDFELAYLLLRTRVDPRLALLLRDTTMMYFSCLPSLSLSIIACSDLIRALILFRHTNENIDCLAESAGPRAYVTLNLPLSEA